MLFLSLYLNVIGTAFFVFPILAFIFTIPYLIFQYKTFGAIPLLRSAILYSFILYCLTAYFLVILPLPSRESVAAMTSARYNLVPGSGLISFWRNNHLSFRDIDSYIRLFFSPAMREILFNVCMLFPLGVYLRYYFKCKMGLTVLLGFLMSLFFELTQLSGLYGIYPRPYRLFDVTDLLDNTFGAWLGYLCTPIFCFFLPSREELDMRAYQKGQKVPFLRRVFAAVIDWLALIVFYVAIESVGTEVFPVLRQMQWLKPIIMSCSVLIYFGFFQWLCRGYTAGKLFLHLRLVDRLGGRPKLWACCARYALLYGLVLPAPYYAMSFLDAASFLDSGSLEIAGTAFLSALFAGVGCVFCAETVAKLLGSENEYLYGKITSTRIISTIKIPEFAAAFESNVSENSNNGSES